MQTKVFEAALLQVLDPEQADPYARRSVTDAFSTLANRDVTLVYDEAVREDRRTLDRALLRCLGYADGSQLESDLDELYAATVAIVRHRMQRAALRESDIEDEPE